ncbi:putative RNA-binding protein associated with RNAse of E/G family [Actinokineospora baliensis]|uniref:DUF402 domain-containing protein n=1 Tax=Actinokineospora baliensis TaxID=547056 RepID=UPI00195CDF8D|nr:DUF402 domain-containing protein [Actinokineospora baliensis]MBM7775458.1 putative RNA-binding protein associated with RNAse of E/G family [Actinokineospora baliensis]
MRASTEPVLGDLPIPPSRQDEHAHEIHPPKVELFDPAAMTNTDPKGFARAVEVYRETPDGLYMSRPVDGHHRIAHFESLLLPEAGLRVSKWRPRPGVDLGHDFYIDVVDITRDGRVWRTVDLYLDVLVRTGRDTRVEDCDELLAAFRAGLVDLATAERAMARGYALVAEVAETGHDVDRWLATTGVPAPWRSQTRPWQT